MTLFVMAAKRLSPRFRMLQEAPIFGQLTPKQLQVLMCHLIKLLFTMYFTTTWAASIQQALRLWSIPFQPFPLIQETFVWGILYSLLHRLM